MKVSKSVGVGEGLGRWINDHVFRWLKDWAVRVGWEKGKWVGEARCLKLGRNRCGASYLRSGPPHFDPEADEC